MTNLSAREQRLIALLILLLMLAGAWLIVIAPVLDGFAARKAEREQLLTTIQHNERLIAAMPTLQRRFEAQRPDRGRFVLIAANREVAGDLLRQRLQRTLETSGASISGLGEGAVGQQWVGASVEGALTLDQLVRVLSDLQNQTPYLVVTGLTVVADRAFQSGKLDVMNVKIDVAIPYSQTA